MKEKMELVANKEVEPVIKLIDFNAAVKIEHDKFKLERMGEERYSAPEMRFGRCYNHKIDIWSYGITLFKLFSNGKILDLNL